MRGMQRRKFVLRFLYLWLLANKVFICIFKTLNRPNKTKSISCPVRRKWKLYGSVPDNFPHSQNSKQFSQRNCRLLLPLKWRPRPTTTPCWRTSFFLLLILSSPTMLVRAFDPSWNNLYVNPPPFLLLSILVAIDKENHVLSCRFSLQYLYSGTDHVSLKAKKKKLIELMGLFYFLGWSNTPLWIFSATKQSTSDCTCDKLFSSRWFEWTDHVSLKEKKKKTDWINGSILFSRMIKHTPMNFLSNQVEYYWLRCVINSLLVDYLDMGKS